jgi:60 kDa SS-A/Ro ribonucleoprotein
MTYSKDLKPGLCTEKVHGETMIKGLGGGYGFEVDDMERLRRFLILGHEGGTYYADQRTLTVESVECLDRLAKSNPIGCVNEIVAISQAGRAPKNDPAIFALAYLASKTGTDVSILALQHLKDVCRIGTHLFDFLNNCKDLGRGWGSAFKREVGNWFNRHPMSLAKQVTKYQQRNGWSMRDVLRKCHFNSAQHNQVLRYVTQRDLWWNEPCNTEDEVTAFLLAVEEAKNEKTSNERRADLIRQYGLVREHMPTEALNDLGVWKALLEKMPLTAMIRNLGKMTSMGLLKPLSVESQIVVNALRDTEALKAQRVHPVAILLASRVYQNGRGIQGSLSWSPVQPIVGALDDAFYLAFDHVEPTNKRFLLGVDCSGSMEGWASNCIGNPLIKARIAAAVMAMLGMTAVGWQVRGRDAVSGNPRAIEARVVDGITAGGVILLHDGSGLGGKRDLSATVAALPAIIAAIRKKGLRFVRLDELLDVDGYRSLAAS